MREVRIPQVCAFCRIFPKDIAAYRYPLSGDRVLCMVAWSGIDAKLNPLFTLEVEAGLTPDIARFPTVTKFVPTSSWCPACLTLYHIGQHHPADAEPAKNNKTKQASV